MTISCKNDNNNTKGSDFYKQSIILKNFFDKNNTTNCGIMHKNV